MKIKDFAKERNVNADAVRKRINRNQEYKKHTFKDNDNELCLDDELYEIFDKLYPYEHLVVNEKELELMNRINQLQSDLIESQKESKSLIEYKVKYESTKYLLDNQKEEIKELKKNSENLKNEVDSFQKTFFGLYKKK